MAIKVPKGLPALQIVRDEGIAVEELQSTTATTLRVALLNIMPMKETTEADFIRILSSTGVDIELTLMKLDTHTPRHATEEHMSRYYTSFGSLKNRRFDALIITGAPIEKIEYEEVTYWSELCEIFDWSQSNVKSVFHICWAAQAGLYYKFGIQKHLLPAKMFGIIKQYAKVASHPLLEGCGEEFCVPQSRHTTLHRDEVAAETRIEILAESEDGDVYIVQERGTRNFFITGHSEYALYTLDSEYKRDVSKGLPIDLPCNYYPGDDPSKEPVNKWSGHAVKLFSNWLKKYAK